MDLARIYLSAPDVGVMEERRALEAIQSGWAAPIGPALEEFERAVAHLSGRKYAIALSSGTAALHLGLLALGVKPGDYVVCSTLTFVATANAVAYVGAHPVFVDSDVDTGNMSPRLLERALEQLAVSGRAASAVIPVDFLGTVANYEEITEICGRHGVPVLADAAESVGATRNGAPAGSFGDAAVFSFNGNKIMTTSGGGAFLTDNSDHARAVRHLATQAREPVQHYEHKVLGFNYRMSNILAAVGLAQLSRLETMIGQRRRNRLLYRDLFAKAPGVRVLGASDAEDNCWLSAVLVDPDSAGFSAADLGIWLEALNIETRPIWKPMHLQPLYAEAQSFTDGSAESLFMTGLALPSGSGMNKPDWERISAAVAGFLDAQASGVA